ncbi:hypothetical protein [Convivina praedatoris]|uniref:DUF3888 domain-containing protein n=1 Tax=Convivina praedatoris TaxID=2880963 RepID=A0ABN8HCW9_9LACO|nr:hypothetical protein [Convivina sp. LMG 32447]CAH1851653.1 hypothetical protein R077815_00368 [Convivina sp. LMG 32447]CAH1853710.1 hypothetical protein LMG032447_00700 [Convivina sp. LMG 32447]CAH1854348.1 hypothetical protein R078138_00862 [Convivina sp. LMG 32447]
MQKKYKYLIVAIVSVALTILSLGLLAENNHALPYYQDEGNHVVLSDKVNQLSSNKQKDEMFILAREALKKAINNDSKIKWENFEDKNLYIEKVNQPHQYYFGYTIQSTSPAVVRIRYNMLIEINKDDSRAEQKDLQVLDMKMGLE